jgi:hypothetical protein
MDVLRGLGAAGQGACDNADLALFLTTRMHVWAPSMLGGALAGAWVFKTFGGENEWAVLIASAAGAVAGLGLSFQLSSDHKISRGCAQIGRGVERALGKKNKK